MQDKILQACRKYNLFSRNDHVMVGVSGGADSVALLHAMHGLAAELGIKIMVAHLNHALRGVEADVDQEFVERLAERLDVPYVSGRTNVNQLAVSERISIEMAARLARYDFFAVAARKVGANTVATAHTSDDQAETLILKLARGAGPGGLGGISRENIINNLRIVRPMLDISRADVMKFLSQHDIRWREDRTNDDLSFLRNKVRHVVLPMMEKGLNPQIKIALNRASEILQSENRWLEEIAAKKLAESMDKDGTLRVESVKHNPVGARRRVIRAWLVALGLPPEKVDFETIERLDELLGRKRGSVNIPGNITVKKRYDTLTLLPAEGIVINPFRAEVDPAGETILTSEGLRITVSKAIGLIKDRTARAGTLPARASISSSAVGRKKIYIRSWREGDRMRPLGLGGTKKLQDIFVDEKVPSEQRGEIPIFECGREIIWIPGYRVAAGWEVQEKDRSAMQIYIERI